MNLLSLLSSTLQPICFVCEGPLSKPSEKICSWCSLPHFETDESICLRCGSISLSGESTCSACDLFPLPMRQIRSLWRYEDSVADAIRKMKYHRNEPLCVFLAEILVKHIEELFFLSDWDLVLGIPTHRKRFADRGFHPPEILSKHIRNRLLRPNRSLSRRALTVATIFPPQASRAHHKRYAILKNGFSANPQKVKGKNILLVDDVLTTGATLCSATHALKQAGARHVDAVTLARSSHWSESRAELSRYLRSIK